MILKICILFIVFFCSCECQDQTQLPEGSPCSDSDRNGTCVNLYKCYTAATYYDYRFTGQTDAIKSLTEPKVCSYRKDGEPVVCCTDCVLDEKEKLKTEITLMNGVPYKKPKNSKAFNKCMEYMRELPYKCRGQSSYRFGVNYNNRLKCTYLLKQGFGVGGYEAERWQFPHMALLGYGDDPDSAQWLCGGTVISERFILTAAHCSATSARQPVSFAGLGVLTRSELTNYWKIYNIEAVIRHPDYTPPSKYNDIALLKTAREINFGKGLLPACLDIGIMNIASGSAPGWGRLGHKGNLADHLMVMDLHRYNDSMCSDIYPKHRHLKKGFDVDSQICFGRQDKVVDTCQGDSGGPLQTHIMDCMFIVFGVTSFGKDCGIPGNAGMYTKVLRYVPWIESVVWPDF